MGYRIPKDAKATILNVNIGGEAYKPVFVEMGGVILDYLPSVCGYKVKLADGSEVACAPEEIVLEYRVHEVTKPGTLGKRLRSFATRGEAEAYIEGRQDAEEDTGARLEARPFGYRIEKAP